MRAHPHNRLLKFGDFEVDLDAAVVRSGGTIVVVEPQVFELIAFLVANPGRLVSYDEIVENVWKGRIVSDAAIATRVNAARKALGDDGATQRVIKTVRGRGLRFDLKPLDTGKPLQPDVRQAPRGQTEPGQSVIGVVPFELLGEDVTQTYLATGIADEITAGLCRFHSLTVLARDSMHRVSRSGSGAPGPMEEFGATHFVRGSMQVRTSMIRMVAQLVEVATGRLIWSQRYDFGREQFFRSPGRCRVPGGEHLVWETDRRPHRWQCAEIDCIPTGTGGTRALSFFLRQAAVKRSKHFSA